MTTTRVIVHVGFHKTGTTSLQAYLAKHQARLAPYLTFYGMEAFQSAGAAARIYGQKPFPWRRAAFRRRFAAFLASLPDDPVIVLSRETFSGAMPGHRRFGGRTIRDYAGTAVPLGQVIIEALRARFGPDVKIEFLYTLRERESWIRSIYGHLLRSIHLRDDFAEFRKQFPNLMDPAKEARKIAAQLPLDAVHFARLEDIGDHHEGPASCVLDLLEIPQAVRDTLPRAFRANAGQTRALEAEFLAMNRASRNKRDLKRRKTALLQQARS